MSDRDDVTIVGPAGVLQPGFRGSPEGTLRYATVLPSGWKISRVGPYSRADDTATVVREGLTLQEAAEDLGRPVADLLPYHTARLLDSWQRLSRALDRHGELLAQYRAATDAPPER